jgi:hypothetical protein
MERVKRTLMIYKSHNMLNKRMLTLAKFYYDIFMKYQKPGKFHFSWTKHEFVNRRAENEDKMKELFISLIKTYS